MKAARDLKYNSNLPANSFLEQLDAARNCGLFCDARLIAQDKAFKVHRVILAVASPYFKNVFEGNEESDIECRDVQAEDLEFILNFIYTGKISIPYNKVRDVLYASKTFRMPELVEACKSFLEHNFDPEDSYDLRSFAVQEGYSEICNKIDDYFNKNLNYVYQSKGFLLLPRLQVTLIASKHCTNLELDNVNSIFERVISWVQKRQQEYGEKLSSLLEESNMLYLQANHLLKDCALDDIDESLDFNSNEDIKKFKRQTSRGKAEIFELSLKPAKRKTSPTPNEYKLIADLQTSDQNAIGLAVLADQLVTIAIHYKTRQSSSNASTVSSDSSGCEDNVLNSSMTMLAPMSKGRCSAGIAAYDKKLYVIGGYNRGCCLHLCEFYDPEINEWTDFEPLSTKRARLEAVTVDSKIYVAGGSDGHEDLASMEVYDPVTRQWQEGKNMIDQRASFGMDKLNNKVYAVGGVSDSVSLKKAECYDVTSATWTRLPNMKVSRENVCAVAHNNKIYAIGGSDGWRCHNTVEVYDPMTDDWENTANMSSPRRGAAAVVCDGKIIVAGGSDGKTALNTVECYDDVTDTWTQMPRMTNCRNNACMVVLDSVPYVIGGFGGYSGTEFLNTVEYFDKVSAEWKVYIHG